MGLKSSNAFLSISEHLFAPYMGLKRKLDDLTAQTVSFAPYMGLKRIEVMNF